MSPYTSNASDSHTVLHPLWLCFEMARQVPRRHAVNLVEDLVDEYRSYSSTKVVNSVWKSTTKAAEIVFQLLF
jgi:hypothetical protein